MLPHRLMPYSQSAIVQGLQRADLLLPQFAAHNRYRAAHHHHVKSYVLCHRPWIMWLPVTTRNSYLLVIESVAFTLFTPFLFLCSLLCFLLYIQCPRIRVDESQLLFAPPKLCRTEDLGTSHGQAFCDRGVSRHDTGAKTIIYLSVSLPVCAVYVIVCDSDSEQVLWTGWSLFVV